MPGPGSYDETNYDQKPPAARALSFGKAQRGQEKRQEVPGPGHYKIPVKLAETPDYLIPNKNKEAKYV